MDYKHLLYTKENGIATLTLNRPEVFNAINEAISFELQDALKSAARDPEVRVVVLAANGKAFCSGQDLKEIKGSENRSLSESLYKRYNPIIKAMREMPKPIIARVNGVAAGAGCSLALASDLVVASEAASFIEIFIGIGLVPDSGSSWFLMRQLPMAKAFELATRGTKVSASEAQSLGLINYAVPSEELDTKVVELATYYANAPTLAIGLIKKMLNKAATANLDEALQTEAWYQEIAGRSNDYKEGVAAFNEKRKPKFSGN